MISYIEQLYLEITFVIEILMGSLLVKIYYYGCLKCYSLQILALIFLTYFVTNCARLTSSGVILVSQDKVTSDDVWNVPMMHSYAALHSLYEFIC